MSEPEKGRARGAAWRAANPEKVRAWRAENPEKKRTHDATWRAANPEKKRASGAAWAAANPDKCKARVARRRARKRNQLCTCCTRAEVAAVYAHCPEGHEVDHIRALALGGPHCVKNLQALPVAVHRVKTKPDVRAVATAKWLIREQRAGRIPGDPAKTAAALGQPAPA